MFRLLAASRIGRVAFTDAALPAVQPVAYHLDDEEVIFRTRNGSKLAAATRHAMRLIQRLGRWFLGPACRNR